MILRILKYAAIALGALIVTGAILFLFGLRIVLDGGGGVHLGFVVSADKQAQRIAEHRATQQQSAPAPAAGPVTPAASAQPDAAPAAPTEAASKATTAPSSASAYWTDFRGPNRDGHYREQPIVTSWPSGGLKPIWKQPIGGGYASFAIARGRAFTIEQRAGEEVVAAYDVATGRELWTSRWRAKFEEMMGGDGPAGHADVARGAHLCARRPRRAALPRRRQRADGVADEHPRGCRRNEPPVGHGCITAHRR